MMAKDSWFTNPDRWGTDRPKCDRIPAAPRILLHAPAPVHSPYLLHSKGTRFHRMPSAHTTPSCEFGDACIRIVESASLPKTGQDVTLHKK